MIAILQRVSEGKVVIDGEISGQISKGIFILLGVAEGDDEEDARLLADKIVKLRIFTDENDKMNLSVKDIDGELLIVSQFTLLASYRRGNRPDFMNAAKPEEAERLYDYFVSYITPMVKHVGTGHFGADMKCSITNDGPVTIPMDSKVLRGPKKG